MPAPQSAPQSDACTPIPYTPRRPAETPLYQIVQAHLETFLAQAQDESGESTIPSYVEKAFRRYLECGILAYGFARARCDQCGHDFLIAFSCKGRGVCPSCTARRMAETAAHLIDHVLPSLPVRQWVISFPKRLRYFLQRDPCVCSAAPRVVLRIIEKTLKDSSPGAGPTARIGAIAFIHQFGASLNEHTHFHICVIDGVLETAEDDTPLAFFEACLDAATVAATRTTIRRRILRLFVRLHLLEAHDAKLMGEWDHDGGFSLDASVRIEGWDRQGLERLLRYCARPPFALERIEVRDDEQVIYHLPKPTPDGRTVLHLTPLELIGRIAALVPSPRVHRHRYYGVLAPNARLRPAVIALVCTDDGDASGGTTADANLPENSGDETLQRSPARYLWAMLLARLYEVFPLICPLCGGQMRIIAFITDGPVIRNILEHIGEPPRPPPIATARGPPEWDMEEVGLDEMHEWDAPPVDQEPEYNFDQTVSW